MQREGAPGSFPCRPLPLTVKGAYPSMSEALELDGYIAQMKEQVIAWRHYLHANPELSFEEEKTSQYVFEQLQAIGGLELSRPTRTSVVARLVGPHPGKVLAIRADMDALPITEESGVEFASQSPGVMHACGHDGHTAMLLGTVKLLVALRERLHGEVRFFFQHAEELLPGGAQEMVKAGVMTEVDNIIGIHLRSMLPTGKLRVGAGAMSAASDKFYLTIHGKGGHAAYPHQTIDSIAIATQVVTNLQMIVSRNVDPLQSVVLSVTRFVAGTATNIIPGSVEIWGTVRLLDPTLRDVVPPLLERVIKGVTEAHGATYDLRYEFGYLPVVNDTDIAATVRAALVDAFGEDAIEPAQPSLGGEDFSAFLAEKPGTFFYLGGANPAEVEHFPHHHPKFRIDDEALPLGIKAFAAATFRLLGSA